MEDVNVLDARRRAMAKENSTSVGKGDKAWILKKKEQMTRKGKIVKPNSKYTGRKRRPAF